MVWWEFQFDRVAQPNAPVYSTQRGIYRIEQMYESTGLPN